MAGLTGINWAQHTQWEKVVAPNGAVYYRVPGTGYLYDPFLSSAKGRPVLFQDPTPQYEEQQKAKRDAEKARSPEGQLLPVAAGTIGTIGGAYAVRELTKDPSASNAVTELTKNPTKVVPVDTSASAPAPTTAQEAFMQGANAPYPVGTNADGSTQMSDGATVRPDGSVWRGGVQLVGGAAQAYGGYQQYRDGEKIGGAANMAGGAANMYAGYQMATTGAAPSWGGYVAPAVAAAQIGQQMANSEGNTEDRAAASQTEALKSALVLIPGVGWIAYAALAGIDALTGGKATQAWSEANARLNKFNEKIDFGLQKSIHNKLFQQSTRGVQKEHTGQLLQQSDDPAWQQYIQGMRAQHNEEPPDPSKPFAGKYRTWDEYKASGLEADDLTGVYGNLDSFKPDWAQKAGVPNWAQLTFEQRRAVTQRLIDEGLYESKKGEVIVTDKDRAREIYAEMAASGFQPSGPAQVEPPPASAPQNPQPQAGSAFRAPPQVESQPPPGYEGAQPGAIPAGVGRSADAAPALGPNGRPIPPAPATGDDWFRRPPAIEPGFNVEPVARPMTGSPAPTSQQQADVQQAAQGVMQGVMQAQAGGRAPAAINPTWVNGAPPVQYVPPEQPPQTARSAFMRGALGRG